MQSEYQNRREQLVVKNESSNTSLKHQLMSLPGYNSIKHRMPPVFRSVFLIMPQHVGMENRSKSSGVSLSPDDFLFPFEDFTMCLDVRDINRDRDERAVGYILNRVIKQDNEWMVYTITIGTNEYGDPLVPVDVWLTGSTKLTELLKIVNDPEDISAHDLGTQLYGHCEDQQAMTRLTVNLAFMVYLSLKEITAFEPVVRNNPKTIKALKSKPKNVLESYVEYMLDMNKPRVRPTPCDTTVNPTTEHTPRKEHERIAHFRHYKSGKVVKVRSCTVNKGSKAGRVEKDYKY